MVNEKEVTEKLVKSLVKKNKSSFVEISNNKEILNGIRCGLFKDQLRMMFQSAEQDIVVHINDNDSNFMFEETDFFKRLPKSLMGNKILIPLIIFEIKFEHVNTHQVRTYSEIARMIKSIFPFCIYNMVLINISMNENNNVDRVYMSSNNFDKILYKSEYKINNKIHNQLVDEMHNIIEEHLNYLKTEDYFRLSKFI